VTFPPQQDEWHHTARLYFLPWVARVFGTGPLTGHTKVFPAKAEALTAETIEGMQEVFSRVSWRFLAKSWGWPRLTTSERSDPHRLWETNHPPLEFTSQSLLLLCRLHQATASEADFEILDIPETKSSGDLLIEHLVFTRLFNAPVLSGIPMHYKWDSWFRNPLNEMDQAILISKDLPDLDILFTSGLEPFLPWLLNHWASHWSLRLPERWQGDRMKNWHERLTTILEFLIATLVDKERSDLIPYLFPYFQALDRSTTMDRKNYEQWSEGKTHTEREERLTPWCRHLATTAPILEIHDQIAQTHPVERLAHEKFFMSRYQTANFGELAQALQNFSTELRPTLH